MTYAESRLSKLFPQLRDCEQELLAKIAENLIEKRKQEETIIRVDFTKRGE